MSETKRVNKAISETGYCSRREADKFIEAGQVTVNGQKAVSGQQVGSADVVKVKGKRLSMKPPAVYMAFHKPPGITSTTDSKDPDNIVDFIGYKQRIFPIGRLDKPSEGLIFMTNDGDIVNKILRAGNNHEKEYVVTVNKPITDEFLKKMGKGVKILGTKTKPCKVTKVSKSVFRIILVQGLNRQIRRMAEVCGYEVKRLVRVRIMTVDIKGIAPGKWRYLTDKEISHINRLVESSVKTEEASTEKRASKPKKYIKPSLKKYMEANSRRKPTRTGKPGKKKGRR